MKSKWWIDTPVTEFSEVVDIEKWLAHLETLPSDDAAVSKAKGEARAILEAAQRMELDTPK